MAADEVIASAAPVASLPPVHPPHPPVVPQRTSDGWSTPHLVLRPTSQTGGCYVDILRATDKYTVYLCAHDLKRLNHLASLPGQPGELWHMFSSIPLERLIPSRALEEELQKLLCASSVR